MRYYNKSLDRGATSKRSKGKRETSKEKIYKNGFSPDQGSPPGTAKKGQATDRTAGKRQQRSIVDIDEVSHESVETKQETRRDKKDMTARRFPGPNNTRKISTETPMARKNLKSLGQKSGAFGN